MPTVKNIVPTPVWSVNAPTALSRCNATGKRNFFVPFSYINLLNALHYDKEKFNYLAARGGYKRKGIQSFHMDNRPKVLQPLTSWYRLLQIHLRG
jgi:hypothetical protein